MTEEQPNSDDIKASDVSASRPAAEEETPGTGPDEAAAEADNSQPASEGKAARSSKEGNEADAVNSLLALVCTGAQEESTEELSPAARIESVAATMRHCAEDDPNRGGDELLTPETKDVLCGRGRGYFNHPGNRRMPLRQSPAQTESEPARAHRAALRPE